MTQIYFKFPIYDDIVDQIKKNATLAGLRRITFYIDLNSINKSFFNIKTVQTELTDNLQNQFMVRDLVTMLKYINNLFSEYETRYVVYFDEGGSKQNIEVDDKYKTQRVSFLDGYIEKGIVTEEDKKKYGEIRKGYFKILEEKIFIKNQLVCINLKNYESDLVAHYCVKNNLIKDSVNIIISADKDLLQSCCLPNTYQLSISYKPSVKNWSINLWDNENAIYKLHENFKADKYDLSFTSDYIPLVQSFYGDTVDNVPQLYPRLGVVTSLKLINEYQLNAVLTENTLLPEELEPYRERMMMNYMLTSFDEQIKRLPPEIKTYINEQVERISPEINMEEIL